MNNRALSNGIKKICLLICPIFEKNLGHWYKYFTAFFKTSINLLVILWIIYFFYAYILFFTKIGTYYNISIFSDIKSINKESYYWKDIYLKLLHHNINIKKLHSKLFVVENSLLYYGAMFPPGTQLSIHNALGFTYGNTIYLKKNKKVNISNIIAHELVHVWQNSHYKPWLYMHIMMPKWIMEGYAVYASEEKRLTKYGITISEFLKKYKKTSLSLKSIDKHWRSKHTYTLWGLMVKHAIEKMHYSVDELHEGKVEYDEVLDSLLEEYNITKESK